MSKVGFDLDGTVYAEPELWTQVARGLKDRGNTVGVLTARNPKAHKQLDMLRLRDMGFPVDFYVGMDADDPARGESHREWKLSQMRRLAIDYLFDDFDTGVVQLVCHTGYATHGNPY